MSLENAILELAKAMNRVADSLRPTNICLTENSPVGTTGEDLDKKFIEIPLNILKEKGYEFTNLHQDKSFNLKDFSLANISISQEQRDQGKKEVAEDIAKEVIVDVIMECVETTTKKPPAKKKKIETVSVETACVLANMNEEELRIFDEENSIYNLEDCRNALIRHNEKHKSYDSSQALLKHFNAGIVGDLKPEQFKDFIELANKGKFGAK